MAKSKWTENCPVGTERTGKPTRHHWNRVHGRTEKYVPSGNDWAVSGQNSVQCNMCHEVTDEIHGCDTFVSSYIGNWPHYRNCDKRAKNHVTRRMGLLHKIEEGDWWVCNVHTVEHMQEKQRAKDARERAQFDARMASVYRSAAAPGYEQLLVDLADWLTNNLDIIEADEWLASIVRKMEDDPNLRAAMAKKFGHELIVPLKGVQ